MTSWSTIKEALSYHHRARKIEIQFIINLIEKEQQMANKIGNEQCDEVPLSILQDVERA